MLVEQLWPSYLSTPDALVLNNKDVNEQHQEFVQASQWVRAPISGTGTMLVTRHEGRLRPEDYLVAHPLQTDIPLSLWHAALNHATITETPETIAALAYTAAINGVYDIARTAWEILC